MAKEATTHTATHMILHFVRHAEAEAVAPRGGDLARRLTTRGRARARRLFRAMTRAEDRPDLILTSEAMRAQETASLLAKAWGRVNIRRDARLNPGCRWEDMRKSIGEAAERGSVIAVVGHEPDLSQALGRLLGGRARVELKKGAVAVLEVDRTIRQGIVLAVVPPRWCRRCAAKT